MKHIALSLLAVAGLAAGATARADHVTVRGSIAIGNPVYAPAPVYVTPAPVYVAPRGYWRETAMNVWVPSQWAIRYDRFGRPTNYWQPGHYEVRNQRVWVEADSRYHHDGRWEHERGEHEGYWNR
jgi:hypothetical protein